MKAFGLCAAVGGTALPQACQSANTQRTSQAFRCLREAHLPARGSRCIRNCTGETQQAQTPPPASASVPSNRRALLAGGAVGAGALFAVLSRKQAVTFATLEGGAVDLDAALANGKPTIIEFYASWCEICRELLPVSAKLEDDFRKDVNFVLLNIDNTKWTSEVAQYRVRGVPHFVFLDSQARQKTAAVGRVPQQILEENARALAAGAKLPYVGVAGKTSVPDTASTSAGRQTMPRDHA